MTVFNVHVLHAAAIVAKTVVRFMVHAPQHVTAAHVNSEHLQWSIEPVGERLQAVLTVFILLL